MGKAIRLTKITAVQNEVTLTLSYHRLPGLYFWQLFLR